MKKVCISEKTSHRKESIQNALFRLLQKQPFHEITVSSICQAADVPRRTFYHYFTGKEDVLNVLLEDRVLKMQLATMFDLSQGDEGLESSFRRFFSGWVQDDYVLLEILLDNHFENYMGRWALQYYESHPFSLNTEENRDSELRSMRTLWDISGVISMLTYWRDCGYRQTPEEMAHIATRIMTNPLVRYE